MIILGIDPGYDRCGLAVLEKTPRGETLLSSSCLTTSPKDPYPHRLAQVGEAVGKLLTDWQPQKVALEKLFFATNRKTANQVSEVRGVIIYLSEKHGVPVVEYTPLQIKQTVAGFGGASKSQVTEMVKRLLKSAPPKALDDEYDAIAVGLTAASHLRFDQE